MADGLALAFQESKLSQSRHEAVIAAWLVPAYLGLAWPGLRPQAGPCTVLVRAKSEHHLLSTLLGLCLDSAWTLPRIMN